MVATTDRLAASASPQTCCTNCNTVFEIPQELLTSQDTRVRCGECLCIFDAMDGLSLPDQQQAQPETQLEDEVSSLGDSGFSDLDVTYSDFDLFSDDAELPEVAYLDETSDAQDLDFGAVDTSNDRTFSDTMFHHDVTINADIPIESTASEDTTDAADEQQAAEQDGVEDEASDSPDALLAQLAGVKYPVEPQVPQEPLVFDYDDEDDDSPLDTADTGPDSPPLVTRPGDIDPVTGAAGGTEPVTLQPAKPRGRKVGPWLLASTMVLSLALLLGGLYAYQERDRLGNNPRTRPLMAAACWLFRCELPAFFDAGQLRILGRHVYTHPDIDGALVVNVVFRNEADVDQRYPVLVVKLSDISGKLVASRDFQPAEYLSDAMLNQSAVLTAKTSLDISLEIRDPGANASSFEMEFR